MLQPQQKNRGKVKVSHAAVKLFDRRGVSCKNAQTVQFSGGIEKCYVMIPHSLPIPESLLIYLKVS